MFYGYINCKSAGFITGLIYHNLYLKNSSLNCVNRCDPQISPTELQLEFRSTHYSTNMYPIRHAIQIDILAALLIFFRMAEFSVLS